MRGLRLRKPVWIAATLLLCAGCASSAVPAGGVGPTLYPQGTRLVLLDPQNTRIRVVVPEDQREKAGGLRTLRVSSGAQVTAVDDSQLLNKQYQDGEVRPIRVKLNGGARDSLEVLIFDDCLSPAPTPTPDFVLYLLCGLIAAAIVLSVLQGMFGLIVAQWRCRERARRLGLPIGRPSLGKGPQPGLVVPRLSGEEWLAWLASRNARQRARPRRDYVWIE
jgi:hypothetical protein